MRLQQQNITRIRPGRTAYAASCIISDSLFSSLLILFNEPMLRNIQKCAVVEKLIELRVILNWRISLDELKKFLVFLLSKELLVVTY